MNSEQVVIQHNKIIHTRRKRVSFPRVIYFLFYFFAVYLVIPVIDVPLLGLSLSAPIFFFIAMAAVFRPPRPWFKQYSSWILLAVLIWFGIFLSTTANGLLSLGVNINNDGFFYLIRYMYWILVFVITAYFANQPSMLERITSILAWCVLLLAVFRWVEVILYGNVGAWTGTRLMTQNAYGFQFSTFSPFVLISVFQAKGKKRLFWVMALLVIWGAAAINASRGSWVAMGLGLAVSFLIFFFSRPRKFIGGLFALLFVAGAGVLAWTYMPKAADAVQERLDTFASLEEDKSYVIRQVMIQKGLRLFQESPLIGVGANRFTLTWTDLTIPELISYVDIENFERRNSHNSYVQFLAEFGLVGSIPLAVLLIILTVRGYKTALSSIKRNNLVPLAIFISFIQMSVHMWVLTALTGTVSWFIYGLLTAVIKRGASQYNPKDLVPAPRRRLEKQFVNISDSQSPRTAEGIEKNR